MSLIEGVEGLLARRVRFALTLWPEWQLPIVRLTSAAKRVECRTWAPGPWILGEPIALHWGRHVGGRAGNVAREEGVRAVLTGARRAGWRPVARHGDSIDLKRAEELATWDLSALACCALGAVIQVTAIIPPGAAEDTWHLPGCFGWRFELLERLADPLPCKGARGLWSLRELIGR